MSLLSEHECTTDGVTRATSCFGITFIVQGPLSDCGAELVDLYTRYLELVGRERFTQPDAVLAELRVREEPSYVFGGALQVALGADDAITAAELASLALPRAAASPVVAHALA